MILRNSAILLVLALTASGLRAQSQLDANRTLFTALAALNAAGYDAEAGSPSNSPVRAAVRAAVQAKNPPVLADLRAFLRAHRRETPAQELSQYISYALCLGDAPQFKPRLTGQNVPPDALALVGFEELLAAFYEQADIESLWQAAQPEFERVIARYHEPVTQAVLSANVFLRNPTSGSRGKNFQVYFDLLGAPNQVHTRSFVDDYFVVITSSAEPKVEEVRTAYLHYLIDPMAMRATPNWLKKAPLADLALASPILDEGYKADFVLLGGMCVVKAVQARLAPPARREAMVQQAMSEGFILTAYFYEGLPAYEKQEQAMRLYLPSMIDAIDMGKEDKRIEKVNFASKREQKVVRPAAPAAAPEPQGLEKELSNAESFYEKRDLERAKESYRKVIQAEGPKPLQAKAYYGLARIAALEKNPELSEQLFQRTLELDPEPPVRAWSHVYLGRLSLAAQEPVEARKQFQAALGVDGASDAARGAAQKGLETLPAPKEN